MHIVASVLTVIFICCAIWYALFGKQSNIATQNPPIERTREKATEFEKLIKPEQKLAEKPPDKSEVVSRGERRRITEVFTLTAYCPCKHCSGKWGNDTAIGVKAKQGRTIAVDPDVIKLGTVVRIDGVGVFMAEDTGGSIKGNRIDIYFESHEEALRFGVQERKVTYDVR